VAERRIMTPKTKKIAWLTVAAVLIAGIVAVCWRLRAEPLGAFHSYSIFPHDSCDLLTFSNGTVTLQTCCGDESWGTYRREGDGHWVWTWRHGTKKPTTNTYIIQPGAFSITCTGTQSPSSSFTLRRRLFSKIPL
jgi:hypothetical protein